MLQNPLSGQINRSGGGNKTREKREKD